MALSLIQRLVTFPFYRCYERRLARLAAMWRRPQHIGIILDGNRRHARMAGLGNVVAGHALGAEKLRTVLSWCCEFEIPVVTIWIFSLENFDRDPVEVTGLLSLIEEKTRAIATDEEIHKNEIRVRYIGRTELLPDGLQDAIRLAESATGNYRKFLLNVAIAYGGRDEITEACRRYVQERTDAGQPLVDVLAGLNPDVLDDYFYTSGSPDPDLILRTSGEVRLSGFLLWQSAYSEFYFCETYWPAFRKIDFLRALREFHHRHRRYGK